MFHKMGDKTAATTGAIGALATLGIDHVNTSIAAAVGFCSLIIVLPKACRTIKYNTLQFVRWVRFYNSK